MISPEFYADQYKNTPHIKSSLKQERNSLTNLVTWRIILRLHKQKQQL